ncbi:GNAT family N-acetyltransferase [Pseudophaeobacter arcticus]|jgi:putative acetyltransferase|uniref:GNAT family N-acetyltransferase n=1 Tax=Pseudophaeobacter arcticus TaxID=385492 RepID=UPI002492C933|nr:GNAT family N-acetyltransferase [Pseudophaeobacter arcticus]
MTLIRPFSPADKLAVLSIWREASAYAHPFLTAEATDQAEAMIRDHFLDLAETYMAEVAGTPVGFISLIQNEVGGLFLRPAFHGRGIGHALMDQAVALKGHLELDVFVENAIGRRFYNRYGFTAGEERMNSFFGHPEIRMHYGEQ